MAQLRVIAAVIVATTALASAATDLIVTAPATWQLDRERSAMMNVTSQSAHHFGAAPSIDVTEAYFPLGQLGAALIVTRSTTTALPDGRDAAIDAAVTELESWGARAEAQHAVITERSGGRVVLDGGKLLEVTSGGRDAAATTRQFSRMIVAADAAKVVTVTGLCLESDDTKPPEHAACLVALATLETGVAAADRATLAFASVPVPAATPPTAVVPALAPASMSDGTKYKMAPIAIPQDDSSDHRIVYFGLGLVVLAGVFYWNRKQRERFDGDRGAKTSRPRERDGDADALHAAATATDEDPKANHHD